MLMMIINKGMGTKKPLKLIIKLILELLQIINKKIIARKMKKIRKTKRFFMTKNMMKKIFSFMMTGMKMEIYSKVIYKQKRNNKKKKVKIIMMKKKMKKKLKMKKKMKQMKIGVRVNQLIKIVISLSIKIKIKKILMKVLGSIIVNLLRATQILIQKTNKKNISRNFKRTKEFLSD